MKTDAQRRAKRKYDSVHTKMVSMQLNLNTDADILAFLASKDNKQGYLKDLIRADMQKGEQ